MNPAYWAQTTQPSFLSFVSWDVPLLWWLCLCAVLQASTQVTSLQHLQCLHGEWVAVLLMVGCTVWEGLVQWVSEVSIACMAGASLATQTWNGMVLPAQALPCCNEPCGVRQHLLAPLLTAPTNAPRASCMHAHYTACRWGGCCGVPTSAAMCITKCFLSPHCLC